MSRNERPAYEGSPHLLNALSDLLGLFLLFGTTMAITFSAVG